MRCSDAKYKKRTVFSVIHQKMDTNSSGNNGKLKEEKKKNFKKPKTDESALALPIEKKKSNEDAPNVYAFNQQISQCASRKELNQAQEIFQKVKDFSIANKHTYAAMMNVAIRCGQIQYAEQLFQEIKALKYNYKDVVLYTTLMRGFCLNHLIMKAEHLLDELVMHYKNSVSKANSELKEGETKTDTPVNTSLIPNVRTINTILRGCIQNGNLTIAEKSLNLYQKEFHLTIDINTWEYLVILYSQTFLVHRIFPVLGRLKKDFQWQTADEGTIYSLLSMNVYLLKSLFLLQEKKLIVKQLPIIKELFSQFEQWKSNNASNDNNAENSNKTESDAHLKGGKRGWKQRENNPAVDAEDDGDDLVLQKREESLVIYRNHLLEEWKYEVSLMDSVLQFLNNNNGSSTSSSPFQKLFNYFSHLFCFDKEIIQLIPSEIRNHPSSSFYMYHLLFTLSQKFGLFNLLQHFFPVNSVSVIEKIFFNEFRQQFPEFKKLLIGKGEDDEKTQEGKQGGGKKDPKQEQKKNQEKQRKKLEELSKKYFSCDKILLLKDLSKEEKSHQNYSVLQSHLQTFIQQFKSSFAANSSGMLNFANVFTDLKKKNDSKELKYNLEICSGNGDWAVEQARNDPENAWITVELRSDRVFHTLYKSFINSFQSSTSSLPSSSSNLLMIQSDAFYLLPNHFPSNSMRHIFVNHPEPPQQTSAKQSSDADHLLNPFFFKEVERILLPNEGMVTIVTDNLWYGKLLIHLLFEEIYVKRNITQLKSYKPSSSSSEAPSSERLNKFNLKDDKKKKKKETPDKEVTEVQEKDKNDNDMKNWKTEYSEEDLVLYEGEPGKIAGHIVSNASSYFDRYLQYFMFNFFLSFVVVLCVVVARLWKRSELKKRYFIVLVKDPTFQIPSFRNYLPSAAITVATAPTAGVTQKVAGGATGVNEKKRKHIVFEEQATEGNQANKQTEEDNELTEPMQEEEEEKDAEEENEHDEGDQLQNQLRKLIGGHKRNETETKVNNNNRGLGKNLPSQDKKKWKNKNHNKNKKQNNHQSN
jgi:tRNA G46 methylase TrmB